MVKEWPRRKEGQFEGQARKDGGHDKHHSVQIGTDYQK
jgi:hypothetical protein